MTFTSTIGTQLTPANPVDVLLGPNENLANVANTLVLIGSMGPTGGPSGGGTASGNQVPYTAVSIANVASVTAASGEVGTKFGNNSVIANMVLAAVTALAPGSNFPPITAIPLPQGATGFGTALTVVLDKLPSVEFVATQFDANDSVNRPLLIAEVTAMSGAQRTSNNQFGTFAVMANTTQATVSSLPQPSVQFFVGVYLYDSSGNPYSVGQIAAATAAIMAANPVPFNGLDNVVVPGVSAPVNMNDWISVGGGLQSELILEQGFTPLRVLPNGTVAFVRTITSRLNTAVYLDVQDFQVLYYFRDVVATRFSQPDFVNQKASALEAASAKGEIIGLMQTFEDQGMFEGVSELAKQVIVQTNPVQTSRFDVYVPVTVVPNLHEIATDVVAGTQFDQFSV